ncbi:MAG: hypothetical protein K8I00_00510 [Candidatus Omnitrophica bacterium]|nr:hypothetical protein [Candidatus Omnitrophota bacterium]
MELFDRITEGLKPYGYVESRDTIHDGVDYIAYVENPPPLKVRNLCAVLKPPSVVRSNAAAKAFFSKVRNGLLNKYGNAIIWKELEICFVVLCEDEIYQEMKSDDGKASAEAQFSLNAMMGTVFVNTSTFEHFEHSTWGLYFSGNHYKALNKVVEDWCAEQKSK